MLLLVFEKLQVSNRFQFPFTKSTLEWYSLIFPIGQKIFKLDLFFKIEMSGKITENRIPRILVEANHNFKYMLKYMKI